MSSKEQKIQNNNERSFVFEQTEIVLTGRAAKRTLRAGKVEFLYEITPKNDRDGSWKKWVRIQELFEITEDRE